MFINFKKGLKLKLLLQNLKYEIAKFCLSHMSHADNKLIPKRCRVKKSMLNIGIFNPLYLSHGHEAKKHFFPIEN